MPRSNSKKHQKDATPGNTRSEAEATVNERAGTSSPASKKRKSTTVPQIPPVEIKPNISTLSYIKFGKLHPSTDIETQLNGLVNGVPVVSFVNPRHDFESSRTRTRLKSDKANSNLNLNSTRLAGPLWVTYNESIQCVGEQVVRYTLDLSLTYYQLNM